jgi:hypothetical protein
VLVAGEGREMLFERFTERARRALRSAEEEAKRLNHGYVGTEHILLGLVREGEGVAGRVLSSLGVGLSNARSAVESLTDRGSRPASRVRGFTRLAKKVLKLALFEARQLHHNYIGTEHLLLGLLRLGEGGAPAVLESLHVDPQQLRDQTIRQAVSVGPRPFEPLGPRDNVVTSRIEDRDLDAIDALIEAGIRTTRSDAAAWLIRTGIDANRALFEKVYATVGEIRRLREQAQALTQQLTTGEPRIADETPPQPPQSPEGETPSGGEARASD